MKLLFATLLSAMIMAVSCDSESPKANTTIEYTIEISHSCADIGYSYALLGKSREDLHSAIDKMVEESKQKALIGR